MRRSIRLSITWAVAVAAMSAGLAFVYQRGGNDAPNDQVEASPVAKADPDLLEPGCQGAGQTDLGEVGPDRRVARCVPGWPEPGPPVDETLRIAVTDDSRAGAPVTVAEERGEFAAEGLDVEVAAMSSHDAHAALARGDLDVVVGNLDAAVFDTVAAGEDVRWVMGGTIAAVPDDPDIAQEGLWMHPGVIRDDGEDWSKVKGHMLALPGGLDGVLVHRLNAALDQGMSSLNAIDMLSLDGPAAVSALEVGEVSGAWIRADDAQRMRDGGFELVVTLPTGEPLDGTVMSGELLGPDRPVGLAYVRAITRTISTHFTTSSTPADEMGGESPSVQDWEIRTGTTDRLQSSYIQAGSVAYETPLSEVDLVDRSLVEEVTRLRG